MQIWTCGGDSHIMRAIYLQTIYKTNKPTSWSWVRVQKPPFAEPLKNFLPFMEPDGSFSCSQQPLQCFLSAPHASSPYSSPAHTAMRLGLPTDPVPSGFPTNTLYTFIFSSMHATCPRHLILLDFDHSNFIRWRVQVMKLVIMQLSPSSNYSIPLLSK
jgi:hypothetical protein